MAARAAGNGDSFALDRSRLGSSHSWKAMPSLDGLGASCHHPSPASSARRRPTCSSGTLKASASSTSL